MPAWLINGQTPEALGVTIVSRTLVSLGVSTVLITSQVDVRTAVFSAGQLVTITRDGVTWFKGHVKQPRRATSDADEATRYVIQCPWGHVFARLMFCSESADEDEEVTLGGSGKVTIVGGGEVTSVALARVLDYAESYAGDHWQNGISWTSIAKPERSYANNRKVSEVIQAILRWHRDIALYWDWSTTKPTLRLAQRGAVTPQVYAYKTAPLAGAELERDEPISGVVVRMESKLEDGAGTAVNYDEYPEDTPMTALDALVVTLSVKNDALPSGIAQTIYQAAQPTPLVGTVTFRERECARGLHPGSVIEITGGPADWEDVPLQVQSVTESLRTGETVAQVGWSRELGVPSTALYRSYGEQGKDEALATEDLVREIVEEEIEAALDPEEPGEPEEPEEPTWTNTVPGTPLTLYAWQWPDERWGVRVTPGQLIVGEGDPGTSYTWAGVALDEQWQLIAPGVDMSLFAFAELEPKAVEFLMKTELGAFTSEWLGTGWGEVIEASITDDLGTGRLGTVNPETGEVIDTHRIYARLGRVVWPLEEPFPTVHLVVKGNMVPFLALPNQLFMLGVGGGA